LKHQPNTPKLLIQVLVLSGAIKASKAVQTPDLKISLPGGLLCVELAIIAVLHIIAYPTKPYEWAGSDGGVKGSVPAGFYKGGFLGLGAFVEALNPKDFFIGVYKALRWLFIDRRYRYLTGRSTYESLEDEATEVDHVGESAVPLKTLPTNQGG
jgi:hypothetical protein